MATGRDAAKRREYAAKLVLMLVFLGGLAAFIAYMTIWGPGLAAFQLRWLDLVLLVFATYRMGHLIAYDLVTEPLRKFFAETVPDSTGAGESVEPRGEGARRAVGQLISCPICSGTWAAAVMVYALYLWPDPTRVFLLVLASIGAAELLNAAGEAFSWTGQNQRTLAGRELMAQRDAIARRKNIIRIEPPCPEEPLPERDEAEKAAQRARRIP